MNYICAAHSLTQTVAPLNHLGENRFLTLLQLHIHVLFSRTGEGKALTSFLADSQATLQLLKWDWLVLVEVTVVSKTSGAFLGLGFLLYITLERLQLPFVDVIATVVVQLAKVPVYHSFFQCMAGVWLREPGTEEAQVPDKWVLSPALSCTCWGARAAHWVRYALCHI